MATYENPWQWNRQAVEWDPNAPKQSPWGETFEQVNPGYAANLMALRDRVQSGQATPQERQQYAEQDAAARAIPMRDPATLRLGWSNDEVGSWDEGGSDWWSMLNGSSPDLGHVILSIRDRIDQGTATPQERALLKETLAYDTDWQSRASDPRRDGSAFGLGDNLTGALMTLALGATGGLAAAPLAAGGASLATTLGSLGTLSGIAGTAAGALGQEMDQDWLTKLGLGLGAAGGIAGGVGGLANLWGSGINSLGDAARLASNAGRVVGGVGTIADNDELKQAGGWLGTAGQLGGGVENLRNLLGGTGGSLQGVMGLLKPLQKITGQFMQPGGRPKAGQGTPQRPVGATVSAPQRPMDTEPAMQGSGAAPGAGPSGIQGLLQAAQQAQHRGGPLTDQDWLRRDWRLRNPAVQSALYNL